MSGAAHAPSMAMRSLARKLGLVLREGRFARNLGQAEAAAGAGLSQPTWCRLECGQGGSASLDTWEAAASAVGLRFSATLIATSGEPLPGDVLLAEIQRFVCAFAEQGGWVLDGEPGPFLRLRRDQRDEVAIVRVGRSIDDLWAEIDDLLDESPAGNGLMVLHTTVRSRAYLDRHEDRVRRVLPGRGSDWITGLRTPTVRMPREPGLVWTNRSVTRLIPPFLSLEPGRRRRSEG